MYWYTNVSYLAINLDKLGNTLPGFWKSLSIFILFIVVYIYIGPRRPHKLRTGTNVQHSNPNWASHIIGLSESPPGYELRMAKSRWELLNTSPWEFIVLLELIMILVYLNGGLVFHNMSRPKYDWILLEAISNVVKKPSVMHVSVFIRNVYCITFNERLE